MATTGNHRTRPTWESRRRPATVWLLVGILALLGATALGGGVELVLYPQGNQFVDSEWLEEIPLVDSFAIPGLVLGLVFGSVRC